MQIEITTPTSERQGSLRCIRDDGSETWQHSSPYFAYHDLIHCAVETSLGYRNAFWGLIETGKALDEFGTRYSVVDTYTCEEAWAESIVGMLQWPGVAGGPDLTYSDLISSLEATFGSHACGRPEITEQQLFTIRERMRALHKRLAETPPGGVVRLSFSEMVY